MTAQHDQLDLTQWVLAAAGFAPPCELPTLDTDRLAMAGLATGLTATVAALLGTDAPSDWRPLLDEQRSEVDQRTRRFAALLPRVLDTLAVADVAATPVKGAVLTAADGVWRWPDTRPMSDIDLLVAPGDRLAARTVLLDAGFTLERSTRWEDSFLAWGDGGVGRTDGESADHNGKVEVHPGWVESIGPVLLDGTAVLLTRRRPDTVGGAPAHVLDPVAVTAHVLGHLSSTVLRREVRALNVVDLALCLDALTDDQRADLDDLCAALDPRLVIPGRWLLHAMAGPGRWTPPPPTDAFGRRLTERLGATAPETVLRVWGASTSFGWRWGLARSLGERRAVVAAAVAGRMARRSDTPTQQH